MELLALKLQLFGEVPWSFGSFRKGHFIVLIFQKSCESVVVLSFLKSAWAAYPKAVGTELAFLCEVSVSTGSSGSLLQRSR